MMVASFLWFGSVCAMEGAPVLDNAMSVRVSPPWSIEVGPGTVVIGTRTIALPAAVPLDVPPSPVLQVRDEEHASLPVFNPDTGGWVKGAKLACLIAQECSATGLLYPESVRVKRAPGNSPPFVQATDYEIDGFWGTFGRVEGGAIAEGQPVYVDYDYAPCRLDSVVVDEAGRVRLIAGEPGVAVLLRPAAADGELALVNVWVPGRTERLTDENLYPIEFQDAPAPPEPVAEKLLPKTLAKLRAGDPVTIVAWGDSVTNGGGVGERGLWYQYRFAALLEERFPESHITMLTAAWPGGNSKGYMTAPKGGTYDFVRDVLEPKPDLITIEFVNDAYLDEEATQAHYATIMEQLNGIGAEVILITPHYVRPDWMGVTTLKVDNDPRPYVKGLRRFAAERGIAVVDASKEWGRLWRQGIPYTTLFLNGINHPDARGHAIFANALIHVFPDE